VAYGYDAQGWGRPVSDIAAAADALDNLRALLVALSMQSF
jgi:hypothetical protein